MINLITDLISFTQPTNLDKETLSVIESIAKIKKVVNECITQFNNLENKTNEDYQNFLNQIKEYKEYCKELIQSYYNNVNATIEEFKHLIELLKGIDEVVNYVEAQSKFVQDLAKQNQDAIDKGTIATQNQINQLLSQINDITSKRLFSFITPEMFGCVGDGVTDDTENLKRAIQYAVENSVTVISSRNKNYLVSSPIKIDLKTGSSVLTNKKGLHINFGFSTIICNTEMDNIFIIEMFIGGKIQDNTIENIRFICNEKTNPIEVTNANNLRLKNVFIIDPKDYGIKVNKGAIFFDSGYFAKYSFNNTDTYGIYIISGTDSKISNIQLQDFKYPIKDNGDANFYRNIHPWVMTPSQIIGSLAFDFKGGGNMNECYIDTYETAINIQQDFVVVINNCHMFINTEFYKDDVTVTTPKFITGHSSVPLNRAVIQGCYLRFPFKGDGVAGGNFTDIAPSLLNDEKYVDLLKNNRIENCGMLPYVSGGKSELKLGVGYTPVTNSLINKNGKIYVELKLDFENEFSQNYFENLGDFPEGYKSKITSTWRHETAYIYNADEENQDNPDLEFVDVYIKSDKGVNCIFVKIPENANVTNKKRIYCNFELESRTTSYFNNFYN